MEIQGLSTKLIHARYSIEDSHQSLHMPIYSNAAFEFKNAEDMENAFLGRAPRHMYSRISNPTVEFLEHQVKLLTGSLNVTALSSGMAAISNVFLTIAEAGDNIITSKHLFGNSLSFFESTLSPFGVQIQMCDLTNDKEIEKHINKRTKAIFFETITNPQLEVADIEQLSILSKENKLLLVSDTTMTPPNIFDAKKFGVDIEVISSTKSISGGATSIGGLIVDYGTYNWQNNSKLAAYYLKFGSFAFYSKLRKEVFRNLGACLSPYHAYLQSIGLETLELRYQKAASNCFQIAQFLEKQKNVASVNYPGLKNSKFNEVATKLFGNLPGAVLTFNLGTKEKAFKFLNNLQLIRRATNLYDNKSLIMHPASTIFCEFSPEKRREIGVPDDLIRLSVGIEDNYDLINDISQALQTLNKI